MTDGTAGDADSIVAGGGLDATAPEDRLRVHRPPRRPHRSTRERLFRRYGGEVGLVLLAVALTVIAGYVFGPGQTAAGNKKTQAQERGAVNAGPLLDWQVDYAYGQQDGFVWVSPRPVDPDGSHKSFPMSDGSVVSAIRDRGGFEIGLTPADQHTARHETATRLRLTLVGHRYDGLVVRGLRARVVKRSRPLDASIFFGSPQGAGEPERMGFDLDSSDPQARLLAPDGSLSVAYADSRWIKLERREPIVITAVGFTSQCYCEWVIDVTAADVTRLDDPQVTTIDDHGRPFRSTATTSSYREAYVADLNKRLWRRVDSRTLGRL